jgi:hypothetical protein
MYMPGNLIVVRGPICTTSPPKYSGPELLVDLDVADVEMDVAVGDAAGVGRCEWADAVDAASENTSAAGISLSFMGTRLLEDPRILPALHALVRHLLGEPHQRPADGHVGRCRRGFAERLSDLGVRQPISIRTMMASRSPGFKRCSADS